MILIYGYDFTKYNDAIRFMIFKIWAGVGVGASVGVDINFLKMVKIT